jgi:hypothetical protein
MRESLGHCSWVFRGAPSCSCPTNLNSFSSSTLSSSSFSFSFNVVPAVTRRSHSNRKINYRDIQPFFSFLDDAAAILFEFALVWLFGSSVLAFRGCLMRAQLPFSSRKGVTGTQTFQVEKRQPRVEIKMPN